ncbi:hypothetical protein GCM10022409_48000 [Hymenobacter glaciei]|uniref:Baseplate protein J-like domain-containing protein n=1 Tax=Hymenobacter glaciei TaxID=877209 RepID=A0ABP7UXV1_9BACT
MNFGVLPSRFQPAGTSQQGRRQPALLEGPVELVHAPLEELLAYMARLSTKVRYYEARGGQVESTRNWNLAEQSELFMLALMARQRLTTQYAHFTRLVRQLEDPLALPRQHQFIQGKILSQVFLMAEQLERWWGAQQISSIRSSLEGELRGIVVGLGAGLRQVAAIEQALKDQQVWQPPYPGHRYRPDRMEHLWTMPEPAVDITADSFDNQLRDVLWKFYHAQAQIAAVAKRVLEQVVYHLPQARSAAANMRPEIALLVTFCQLFQHAQHALNELPRRQLNYYYQEVLRVALRPARPDHAYLVFGLAKGVPGYLLPAGTAAEGEKDAHGRRPTFHTTQAQPLTPWRVQQFSSVFVSGIDKGAVQGIWAAQQADSADGRGQPLANPAEGWAPFGEAQELLTPSQRNMGAAAVGFAVSAPVLLLHEGHRTIELDIDFEPESFARQLAAHHAAPVGQQAVRAFEDLVRDAFRIDISGATGWLPLRVEAVYRTPNGTGLTWRLNLDRAQPAVVPHQPELHAGQFRSAWPVLRLRLNAHAPTYGYSSLGALQPHTIAIRVRAHEIQGLQLSNQLGPLASGLPFAPFGPQARMGAYLLVGYPELFRKRLIELALGLHWAELPTEPGGFADYYRNYAPTVTNDSFRVATSYRRDWRWVPATLPGSSVALFQPSGPLRPGTPTLAATTELELNTGAATDFSQQLIDVAASQPSEAATGSLRLELVAPGMGFGIEQYPSLLVETMQYNARHTSEPRPLPRPPFTPQLRSLELRYAAEEVFAAASLFGKPGPGQPQFYHIHPLGEYPPGQAATAASEARTLRLLPEFAAEGTLYIGLAQLAPPQQINLLFELAPFGQFLRQHTAATGAVDQMSQPKVEWAYLSQDEWQKFVPGTALPDKAVRDESHGLTELHPVYLTLPDDMDTRHTVMPDGLFWLRASVAHGTAAISRVRAVHQQVVLTERTTPAVGEPVPFVGHLPARSLSRLARPNPALATVAQPLASFGGAAAEEAAAYNTRVSERLRHRGRAVTPWDYEHLVLEHFPEVYQTKCLRANQVPAAIRRPGLVVVVVTPYPPTATAGYQLPNFSPHQLDRMQALLQRVAAPRIRVQVCNPFYEQVQVRGKVRFTESAKLATPQPGALLARLEQELREFLSPWARAAGAPGQPQGLTGARVLSFLNQRPYVEFVTGFSAVKMALENGQYLFYDTDALDDAAAEAGTEQALDDLTNRPWSVYLSAGHHHLAEVTTVAAKKADFQAQPAGIGNLTIGTDFVIYNRFEPGHEPSPPPALAPQPSQP